MILPGGFGMVRTYKTDAEHLLDQPTRKQLDREIRRRPGKNLRGLCESLGLRRGTAEYHVYMMEQGGQIASVRLGRERRFYAIDLEPRFRWLASVLLQGRTLALAQAISADPGAYQKEIAVKLGMSRKVFRGYADRLVSEGLITEERMSRFNRYFPTDLLGYVLQEIEDSAGDNIGGASMHRP